MLLQSLSAGLLLRKVMSKYGTLYCAECQAAFCPGYHAKRRAQRGLPVFCGTTHANQWKARQRIGLPYSAAWRKE